MRFLLLPLLVLLALAQDGEFQCAPIPSPGQHECHCARMIDDFRARYLAECRKLPTDGAREKCQTTLPQTCDVMDHPGNFGMEKHPDQCSNKCVPVKCYCNEGACQPPTPRKIMPPKKKR